MSKDNRYYEFTFNAQKFLNGVLIFVLLFTVWKLVYAATPDPGHPWREIGDGWWAATGTTGYRTFTFPNATATVMTTLDIVQGDLIYGSAASTTTRLPKDTNATRYLSNTGASNNPLWALVNLSNGITGVLSLANGGTGSIMTASNGGIVYSTATSLAILSGTSTAGRVLQSGTSSAPNWSYATYPSVAGSNGNILMSNGINWISTSSQIRATTTTVATRAPAATGAFTATAMNSLTVRKVGMFNVPQQITVNQISASITTVTTAGTIKKCIYDINGNKLIDVTSAAPVANQTLSTTVSPAVTLKPGNYYYVIGCATTCNDTIRYWTTTTASPLTTLTPTGKTRYEGTFTMTSGTCNATITPSTITAVISSTPVGRLDN